MMVGCGSQAQPANSLGPGPTTSLDVATSSSSTSAVTTTSAAPVSDDYSGSIELPLGELDLGPTDLFVVHVDGDLWLHPGALGETGEAAFRLVDLGDPRVEVSEGPGPNTVDGVVGDVAGVVYYTECCEPISGNLLAVAADNADSVRLGAGYSPVLSPDRTRLATANSYALIVIDIPTGTYEGRSFNSGGPFMNVWDLMWSDDGESLTILYFDEVGFGLMPVAARSPFDQGIPTSLGIAFDPSADFDVHLAGRGPGGEIAVSVRDATATLIRFFEATTLTEIPEMQRSLPVGVTSVRLADDGVGLLWVDNTTLWYLPANGDARNLGSGYTAAWYAN
jgi:hypothetical protein